MVPSWGDLLDGEREGRAGLGKRAAGRGRAACLVDVNDLVFGDAANARIAGRIWALSASLADATVAKGWVAYWCLCIAVGVIAALHTLSIVGTQWTGVVFLRASDISLRPRLARETGICRDVANGIGELGAMLGTSTQAKWCCDAGVAQLVVIVRPVQVTEGALWITLAENGFITKIGIGLSAGHQQECDA